MHTNELRQMTPEALRAKAEELRGTVAQLRYHQFQGKEKNVKKLKNLRHELSRILTLLTERETRTSSNG